jgi:hypothetical protein
MQRRDAWRTQTDRTKLARRARLLLAVVVVSIGVAAALAVMLVGAARHAGHSHLKVDVTAVAAASVAAVLFSAYVGAAGQVRRRSWRRRRLARGSVAVPVAVRVHAEALALSTGQPDMDIVVIRDSTVNAATIGRPGASCLVLTTGACALEPAQLDALLAFCLAQLAGPELRVVRDALTAVALYAKLAKALWILVIAGFIVGLIAGGDGPWVVVSGLGTLGVVVAAICGAAATASALVLAHAAGALADSDAITHTLRPDAYADLLVAMIDDTRETQTKLSPLIWMERNTTRTDLAALAGSYHSQEELAYRAERMCTIAGVPHPET